MIVLYMYILGTWNSWSFYPCLFVYVHAANRNCIIEFMYKSILLYIVYRLLVTYYFHRYFFVRNMETKSEAGGHSFKVVDSLKKLLLHEASRYLNF